MIFDTTDTIVGVRGEADFAKEQLDLKVTPVAKDVSIATLRVPFDVRGPFKDPQITPDRAKLPCTRWWSGAARVAEPARGHASLSSRPAQARTATAPSSWRVPEARACQ